MIEKFNIYPFKINDNIIDSRILETNPSFLFG